MSFPVLGGGTSYDSGNSISLLSDGSSIVTGYFYGTASFGSTTLTSAGVKMSLLPSSMLMVVTHGPKVLVALIMTTDGHRLPE